MRNKAGSAPITTWQFWRACRKSLGDSFLRQVYLRKACEKEAGQELECRAADPRCGNSPVPNPLDGMSILIRTLCDIGEADTARAGIAILAGIAGCGLTVLDDPGMAPCSLAGYPALMDFLAALKNRKSREVVRFLWQQAKVEIDRAYEDGNLAEGQKPRESQTR